MRFHCGISFSWRSIKKFLIPILIGVLAYFGFNFIYDNNSIPLGFLKVNALENYNTRYDIDYSGVTQYIDKYIDSSNHKLIDIVDSLKLNNSIILDYSILINVSQFNKLSYLYLIAYDNSSNYTFNFYGYSDNSFRTVFKSSGSKWGYSINLNGVSDIFSDTSYINFVNCITGGSCNVLSNFSNERILFKSSTSINNSTDNILSFSNNAWILFYSTKNLTINNTYNTNDTNLFYKSIYVNNESVEVGDKFPTYYDLYLSPEPEPEPEPVPDENIVHKALFNKIYWFDDNTTEVGILSSIYILLFLYCLTMVIFKFLAYLHNMNKRW